MFKKALILAGKDIKYMYRDRGAIIASYLAPVLILVIFGIIYSGMGNNTNEWDIDLLVVDQAQTGKSQAFVESLKNESVFNITMTEPANSDEAEIPLTEERVRELILNGDATLGLVYHGEVENPEFPIDVPSMTLMYSPSAGMERQVTSGLIQRDVFMAMGTDFPREGVDLLIEQVGLEGTLAGNMLSGAMERWMNQWEESGQEADGGNGNGGMGAMMEDMVDLNEEEVVNEEVSRGNPFMANSVSGLIVMFLLFSVSYAAASLLKEQEGGTIKRLLMAPITVDAVILGKFLSIGFNSLCQVTVMLIVAELAFHVNILGNLFPVIVISVATVAAVTAFGMIISAIAKSYDQITASITVIVLVMSAIGGSMFPRILMPEWMQKFGLLTINGWSIVGYLDALYYYKGAGSMLGYAPASNFAEFIGNSEALVLILFAIVCGWIAARLFKVRLVRGE